MNSFEAGGRKKYAKEVLVRNLCARYRIEEAEAQRFVEEAIQRDTDFLVALHEASNIQAAMRTRAWKTFEKNLRRKVYQELRTYRRKTDIAPSVVAETDPIALSQSHISTKERSASLKEFHEFTLPLMQNAERILDAGCGLHPLTVPFAELPNLKEYIAIDRDSWCVEVLEKWSRANRESRLRPMLRDFEDLADGSLPEVDLVILLKVVPVIARQRPDFLPNLAALPGHRFLLSGARTSMTKRLSIERREKAVLHKFANTFAFELEAEQETADEILLLLRKPDTT